MVQYVAMVIFCRKCNVRFWKAELLLWPTPFGPLSFYFITIIDLYTVYLHFIDVFVGIGIKMSKQLKKLAT